MNAPTDSSVFSTGLRFDLDIEDYHGGPGISKTGLDHIERSPAIYHALHINPDRPAPPSRAGQLEGSLAHCAILEPSEFEKRYISLPKDAPRRPTEAQWNAKNPSDDSKAAMAWWREWNAATNCATVITCEQRETAMRQADSVRRLPEVREALERGHAETSAFWNDSETGVLCRVRPDWTHTVNETGVILLDVKTCGDASPADFGRQIARKRYHVQDAYYSDGFAHASGLEVLAFIFVAVESEWPYAAAALMLDDDSRDVGRRAYRRNLNTYAECLKNDQWPGFTDSIQIINLPFWAMKEAA